MEVTGQPHTMASLAAEKKPLVPTENDDGWVPETVLTYRRKNVLNHKPSVVQLSAQSLY